MCLILEFKRKRKITHMKLKPVLLVLTLILVSSCFEDRDDNAISVSEIKDFVWKGMNVVYLYKDNMPDLANDRFSSDQEYTDYLNDYSSPKALFDDLTYMPETVDRFSRITDDYIRLEQLLSGVSKSNGMEYGLRKVPGSSNSLYGYVRLVHPGSMADDLGLTRGVVFDTVDNTPLTQDNYVGLLSQDTYTIHLATYDNNDTPQIDDDTIISGSETVTLTKEPFTENPIFKNEVLSVGNEKVGYLMYNGFTGTDQFDSALNSVFQNFAANNISDLVLDLRYNPGGSVRTAIWLCSMITGQFTGDIITTERWNSEIQAQFLSQNPEALNNRFVDKMIKTNSSGNITFEEDVNSLGLNKVYILTTGSSASASEFVINGLNPYIDVVQIGTTTVGKYQASILIYDSPNFSREDVNPNHTYAMLPLVLKEVNSVGFTDFDEGLPPTITLEEDIANLGVLGDESEPLLAAALNEIAGSRTAIPYSEPVELIGDSNDFKPFIKEMYIDKFIPNEIIHQQEN